MDHYGLVTTCEKLQIARAALKEIQSLSANRPSLDHMYKRISANALKKTLGPSPMPRLHEEYIQQTTKTKDHLHG